MPNVTDIPTQVGNQVIDAIRKGEDVAIDAVKSWSETVSNIVPEIKLPFAEQLPSAREAVNSAFVIAQQALETQRQFVLNVLDTVEERLGLAENGKPAPKTKAAKSAPAKATPAKAKDDTAKDDTAGDDTAGDDTETA